MGNRILEKKLLDYAKSDMYPFHMPGHKRVPLEQWNPYQMDITEIDGFDNLHEARELLMEIQKQAAQVYGAEQSFYLVNGSTCGILAAISACVKRRGKILMARNCHKSVYNAAFLRELDVVYVYPEVTRMGIQGQVSVDKIADLLKKEADIEAVLITSPTYDGITSNVAEIAKIVHNYGIPLIVDAAHGAHLGFVESFPENPIHLGADIVIESVHKTLPAFTQTALLHVCSHRIDGSRVKKYLGIYETSSPSYVLMAGIERCVSYIREHGKADLSKLSENLDWFYQKTRNLKNLKVLEKTGLSKEEAYDFDKSKILIFSKNQEVSGAALHKILLEEYHLQMEMVSGQYVLALCSVMDTREGFQRLAEALLEIDDRDIFLKGDTMNWTKESIYREQKQFLPIYKTEELERTEMELQDAEGKVAGEYIYLYPPGIPLIVPGELISKEVIEDIKMCQKAGLTVEGLSGRNRICIVNFS